MAKVHLTDRVLRGLATEKTQEDFWDAVQLGFGVRVGKGKRRKTFFARLRVNGRQVRVKLGLYPHISLQDAREKARQLAAAQARGEEVVLLGKRRSVGDSFADLAEAFLAWAAVNKRQTSYREDRRLLERDILPVLGSRSVAAITKVDVREVVDAFVARGAGVSANRALKLIKRIFNWGLEQDRVKVNPAAQIKPPTKEVPRRRALTWTEIGRAWLAWEEQSPLIEVTLKLLLLTGKRVGEVRHLRWRDIEGDVWTVPGQFSKSKLDLPVPLSSAALALVDAQRSRAGTSEWVLAGREGGPVKYFALRSAIVRMQARLGFDWTIHDLRRTAMTRIAEGGFDKDLIPILLGHTRKEVSDIYNVWSYLPEMRKAFEHWAARVAEVVGEARRELGGADSAKAAAPAGR